MAIENVAVTGGNGKIGEAIIKHLNEHGYYTINIARGKQREDVSDEYRTTDLLDAGEVYGSIARSDADAIIHMGTIPWPTEHPGYVTYESNVMSSYHILEAAHELGLESIVLASSINVLGCAYQDAPVEVFSLPMDEEHPVTPRDPYAMAKHAIEITADGFGRLPDTPQIASLRYPWVATEDEMRETFVEKPRDLEGLREAWHHTTRDVLFSYLHIDDGAEVARLAMEADFDGHERFWTVAADTTAEEPSGVILEEYYPGAEVREEISGTESLISIDKAREMLDWEPTRSWRDL
ncbi:NAD(P)-dependent oxidoreductase [Natronolimnobius sp. AArcel1]|uniref:NAD-dependent epimerase/dehydratase family protein n=1 Tax=Natronolimnobius sp. AArcel1 TaxID=1679093 RepID=UPI0013EC9E1D|nr:NAD(P)-dependent oxidoreductase [Natronolimnobius sp. AArcel1]NGM70373.1 NAD(P)-dependent oxidoreductase [Natronolimnobius sp. AArcel1]